MVFPVERSPFFGGVALCLTLSFSLGHAESGDLPTWTHYGRAGGAQLHAWGGLGYYRIKRIHGNTFYDLRILGIFIPGETLGIVRYKSSRKFDPLPRFYRFNVVSLRHSSTSELTVRYHYNQGVGAFVFNVPVTHMTTEVGLSYDMSDYLNSTRKTSYLKGGVFWDIDWGETRLAIDLEYFQQISDRIPGTGDLTRHELSAEINVPVVRTIRVTVGYEEEFYRSRDLRNVRSVYLALGFKRLLPFTL
ncbi:MAG: hypothetical protein ACE5LH_01015 [Fidelibacterota bacterium]